MTIQLVLLSFVVVEEFGVFLSTAIECLAMYLLENHKMADLAGSAWQKAFVVVVLAVNNLTEQVKR